MEILNKVGEIELVDYKRIKPFQGNLKDLTEKNYEKLKRSILKNGFSAPILVWKDGLEYYALDGHQRCRALFKMEEEGIKIPDVPIVSIRADGYQDAKKILLGLVSQYGDLNKQGLYEELGSINMSVDELNEYFNNDQIDLVDFTEEFYVQTEDLNPESKKTAGVKCPNCGHEF